MADDNGTNPAKADDGPIAGPDIPASERIMGAFGLIVAIGLFAIALDLMTGGAVARLFARPESGPDDGG